MKVLKQILFTFAMVVGLAFSASAQKGEKPKPPPKDRPPVVVPGDKKPPKDNPKDDDKPKKPEMGFLFAARETEFA